MLVRSLDEAVEISNRFAPEHLSIPDASLLAGVRHAGSVFVGPYSPEAAGDYASGPNHVLPTSGAARLRGGLSVTDYLKVISVQELSAAGAAQAGARRSRRWRAPKAWKRTPAAWRCESQPMTPLRLPKGAHQAPRQAVRRAWRPTRRPPAAAPANCASISTRTPSAARRASSSA